MPRTLTDDQKSAITAAIGNTGAAEILIDPSVDDAEAYATELAQVFIDAGWSVTTLPLTIPWGASPSGLCFMTEGDLPIRDVGQALLDAFTATDLEFNQLDAMLPEGVEVKLLVGRVGV